MNGFGYLLWYVFVYAIGIVQTHFCVLLPDLQGGSASNPSSSFCMFPPLVLHIDSALARKVLAHDLSNKGARRSMDHSIYFRVLRVQSPRSGTRHYSNSARTGKDTYVKINTCSICVRIYFFLRGISIFINIYIKRITLIIIQSNRKPFFLWGI